MQAWLAYPQNKNPTAMPGDYFVFGGERGIRTPGPPIGGQRFSRPPHSTALPSLQLYILHSIHRGVYPAPRDHLSNYISYTAFTAEFIPLRGTISPIIYLTQHSPRSLSRSAGPSLQLYILHSIHRGVYPAPRDHLS